LQGRRQGVRLSRRPYSIHEGGSALDEDSEEQGNVAPVERVVDQNTRFELALGPIGARRDRRWQQGVAQPLGVDGVAKDPLEEPVAGLVVGPVVGLGAGLSFVGGHRRAISSNRHAKVPANGLIEIQAHSASGSLPRLLCRRIGRHVVGDVAMQSTLLSRCCCTATSSPPTEGQARRYWSKTCAAESTLTARLSQVARIFGSLQASMRARTSPTLSPSTRCAFSGRFCGPFGHRWFGRLFVTASSGQPDLIDARIDGDDAERWRIGTIAKQLGVHRCTAERVFAQADVVTPDLAPRPSIADPFVPFIKEVSEKYPRLTASLLFDMVAQRGYPGGPDHFRAMIARLRPRKPAENQGRIQGSLASTSTPRANCTW
jgi:hypothetical protein